ncbi:MAG TPA: methyltransferase domain-containing protein [Gaiellaceae bacterium]
MTVDRRRFRSDRLPLDHFDSRFSDDNLAFWPPLFVELAHIRAGDRVLDVGCGTGGYSIAIAAATSARVTGVDESERFIARAREKPGAATFVVGDAERLPFDAASFDRVLLSLVLHQLERPEAALSEAFRVLGDGGIALIRTIAPEDAYDRIPERYLRRMADADAARLLPTDAIVEMLEGAGFTQISAKRVLRNKQLSLPAVEQALRAERARYDFLTDTEIDSAIRQLREDGGPWVDPRPNTILVATKC